MTPAFALRRRPDAAFEALYRRHVREVYGYALAVLGNPSDAEDVTQTTFLNAYRAFQAGERPRKPQNWLRAIAHNVCRQRFRQAARRPRELSALDEIADEQVEEELEGPTADDIARGLRSLPFNQRSALVMRELEGRSQVEIASELGMSVSAVEALLFRARRALREQLEASLTCGEAARAISRGLDGKLSRQERAGLRAHLRECTECATFARQARAQRGALKALGAVPLPGGLASWSALSGSAAEATAAAAAGPAVGIAVKVAAGLLAAGAVAGAGDVGIHKLTEKPAPPEHRAPAARAPAHARVASHPGAAAAIGARPATRHRSTPVTTTRRTKLAPSRPAKPTHATNRQVHQRETPTPPLSLKHRVKPVPTAQPAKPARPHATPHAVHVRPQRQRQPNAQRHPQRQSRGNQGRSSR